ncbi:MAG TPA: hypothetical protein VEN79_09275, partial [Terriglobia bacterium]|nr:hypothetical protein [Terriglobia bacterium]
MWRRAWGALLLGAVMTAVGLCQQPEGYLDVYVAKINPEKRAEFDSVSKKMADANRRNKGDTWLALETAYGEQNTVTFVSNRQNYGEVEKGQEAFTGALNKAFGETGTAVYSQEFNNTLASSRTEIRRRRWDLSYNAPADPAAYAQVVGNARWIRSVIIRVRPGHTLEFEALLKDLNAASQKSNQPGMRWVSQVTEGGNPGMYHLTRFLTAISDLDQSTPLHEMLGEEGYQKFLKINAEAVEDVEYVLYHILPGISCPAEEIAAVAPDFWNLKPKALTKPKPKAPEASKPGAKG